MASSVRGWGRRLGLALGLMCLAALPARAQEPSPDALKVAVSADPASVAAGGSGTIRVSLSLEPDHHIYGHDNHASPTTVTLEPVAGLTFGTAVYPESHELERYEGFKTRELDGKSEVVIPFTVAADAKAGPRTIKVLVDYQICNEAMCLEPVEDEAHSGTLTITAAAKPAPVKPTPTLPEFPGKLPELPGNDEDGTAEIVKVVADATGVTVTVRVTPGWHIGPIVLPDGAIGVPTTFELAGATVSGPITEPKPITKLDAGLTTVYHQGELSFRLPLTYDAGAKRVTGTMRYQVCAQMCFDGSTAIAFDVPADAGQGNANPPPVDPVPTQPVTPTTPGQATAPPAGPSDPAQDEDLRDKSWLGFILACIGGGLFSLIMPCVYPLIPITVTFFAKQAGESGQGKTMGLALMYGLGIITSFTGLGLALALALGSTGANDFAANPWVNIVIAAVFLYLTLALFGVVPLELPKFITNKIQGGGPKKGFVGAYVLGLIFTVVTFTCVLPIAGSLLIIAAEDANYLKAAFGMLVFSTTMAVPFLAFGLFPAMVRKMPMGGGWLHTVKVTGGFIELVLVFYYFSKADFGFHVKGTEGIGDLWISHDLALAIYTATAFIAGTYLLGLWRLPGDTKAENIGVPRMFTAFVFIVLGFQLSVGLSGRDVGALGVLLPPAEEAIATEVDMYVNKWDEGIQAARAKNRPIFLEFTGGFT